MIKILNLYAGIGGNRKLWTDVDVTAVEINPEIAKIYQDFFPNDKVIITDAHQYLLEHYKEFDFIWSSPPCPSHSVTNHFLNAQGIVRYPDMALWQEILFLRHFCKSKWAVENVAPYYKIFIKPYYHYERHIFWANFKIPKNPKKSNFNILNARNSTRQFAYKNIEELEKLHGINLKNMPISNKRKLLCNCVKPEIGLKILTCAFKT